MKTAIAIHILDGILVVALCISACHGAGKDQSGGTMGLYLENDLLVETDEH